METRLVYPAGVGDRLELGGCIVHRRRLAC